MGVAIKVGRTAVAVVVGIDAVSVAATAWACAVCVAAAPTVGAGVQAEMSTRLANKCGALLAEGNWFIARPEQGKILVRIFWRCAYCNPFHH